LAGDIERRVVLKVVIDEASAKKAEASMKQLSQSVKSLGQIGLTSPATKGLKQFDFQLKNISERSLKLHATVARLGRFIRGTFTTGIQKASRVFQRFNMDALSLLFAGMGLQMTFGRVVNSVADLFGMSQAWQTLWISLLSDAVAPLVDKLWELVDWVDSIDPRTKQMIAYFIIGAAVLGTAMMAASMLYQSLYALIIPAKVLAGVLIGAGMGTVAAWGVAAVVFGLILLLLGELINTGFDLKKAFVNIIFDIIELLAKLQDMIINSLITPIKWLLSVAGIEVPEFNVFYGGAMALRHKIYEWAGWEESPTIAERAYSGGPIINIDTVIGTDAEKVREAFSKAMGASPYGAPTVMG